MAGVNGPGMTSDMGGTGAFTSVLHRELTPWDKCGYVSKTNKQTNIQDENCAYYYGDVTRK